MGISRAEALDSFRSDDLIGLGMEADTVRQRLHPDGVVTYAVVCRLACTSPDMDSVVRAAVEMLDRGASGVSLVGAGELGLDGLVGLTAELRRRAREAWVTGLSAREVQRLAAVSGQGVGELLARLSDAGWNSLSPEGPELAVGSDVDGWLAIHEAAHRAGVRTTAAMRFGAGETLEQRAAFLEAVRALQERTGGFTAFVAESAGGGLDGPTAVECLKTVALSRLMLDTIDNVQAGWMATGLKILQTALRFGANDAGDVALDVSRGTLSSYEEDLRRVIRDADFTPVERDAGYRMMFVA